jgi:cytochrome c
MNILPSRKTIAISGFLLAAACLPGIAGAADAAAAEALARKSGCLKCHGIDKKKDGPAFKEIAKKHHGKGAEAKLTDRLMKGDKVKIDGKEEDHDPIKTKDVGEARNVIEWILSL